MDETYIPPAEGFRKLDYAFNTRSSVYLYGATGFGKTTLIKQYLADKYPGYTIPWEHLDEDGYPYFSFNTLNLTDDFFEDEDFTGEDYTEMPPDDDGPSRDVIWLSPMDFDWYIPETGVYCVVIDDLQVVRDERRWQFIMSLSKREDIWLILIGRMPTPHRLMPLVSQCRLVVIAEEDLCLSRDEIAAVAVNMNVSLNEEALDFLFDKSEGNALVVSAALHMMQSGFELNDELRKKLKEAYLSHLEKHVISGWPSELREFLMQVSIVDEFTLPLAVMITGDSQAAVLIEEASASGNFIKEENGVYHIRPQLLDALRSRALKTFGLDKYRQYVDRAGLYFETHDDVIAALNLYEQSGSKDRIHELLLRGARRHPGSTNYFELRRYYLALDESEVEGSPTLMCALSMLYSVLMNAEMSEYWYGKLKAYANSVSGAEKQDANSHLLWLDIGLPHRTSVNMLDVIKRIGSMVRSGGISLPEFSVTNNQPSTMNGGKDFCSWSKNDVMLAGTIGKVMELILGSFGRGLVHAALAESFYEKKKPDYEIFNHLTQASVEVEGGGKTELFFAIQGIHIRMSLVKGNMSRANSLLDGFMKRAASERAVTLLRNARALRCRLTLYTGDLSGAEEWLKEAPDEAEEFCTLERFRYLIKVRCYLALGQNVDAIFLLQMLMRMAEANERPYIRMEAGMLLSIAMYREGEEWKELFLKVLREASEYQFIRIISEECSAVLPLLKEIQKFYFAEPGAKRDWFRTVFTETERISEYYPGYLTGAVQRRQFSEEQLEILRLQASGLALKEIASRLYMSLRAVKYHAAENYRKLDAMGKTDAVQKARDLHLI